MNSNAVGSFAQGLAGGMSMAHKAKEFKTKKAKKPQKDDTTDQKPKDFMGEIGLPRRKF